MILYTQKKESKTTDSLKRMEYIWDWKSW